MLKFLQSKVLVHAQQVVSGGAVIICIFSELFFHEFLWKAKSNNIDDDFVIYNKC